MRLAPLPAPLLLGPDMLSTLGACPLLLRKHARHGSAATGGRPRSQWPRIALTLAASGRSFTVLRQPCAAAHVAAVGCCLAATCARACASASGGGAPESARCAWLRIIVDFALRVLKGDAQQRLAQTHVANGEQLLQQAALVRWQRAGRERRRCEPRSAATQQPPSQHTSYQLLPATNSFFSLPPSGGMRMRLQKLSLVTHGRSSMPWARTYETFALQRQAAGPDLAPHRLARQADARQQRPINNLARRDRRHKAAWARRRARLGASGCQD